MPTAASVAPANTTGHGSSKAPAIIVPFTRAAKEHFEQFVDVTTALQSASSTQLGPYDVAAYGFMRSIVLEVSATGGAGTATVATKADAPWTAISEVALLDVNGSPLVGGSLSGYDLYLINKYGGYSHSSPDPKQDPAYTPVATGANASGNFGFLLRIPVEVNARDGFGALGNQSAAASFKVRVVLAPASDLYSTAPTTLPSVRVRMHLEAWTQPTASDLSGNQNAQYPPAHGSTSFWSKQVLNLASGSQTPRSQRVGNYIRTLILVWRDSTGARQDTSFPSPFQISYDTKLLKNYTDGLWRSELKRWYDLTAAAESPRGLDTGVRVESYARDFDGTPGFELRDGWLWTSPSSRLDFSGSFGTTGTLSIITQDVSPVGSVYV